MKITLTILAVILFSKVVFSQHAPFVHFTPSANSYIDFGKGKYLNCIKTLDDGNKMTITIWVRWSNKNEAGVGNWANLFTLSDSITNGDNGVFWVQHNSGNSKFEFALHTNSREYIQSTTNPQNNQWYFLTLVYDGSLPSQNMKLYVNGNLESSLNKTGNIRTFPGASKLNMGRWAFSGNNHRHFNGSLDEVSIWDIALSSAQINSIMNNPESVTGTNYDATGLLGFWNFDNMSADDLCNCENNGVIGVGTSLPVTFTFINAIYETGKINVKWSTALEINNDYFTVQKSNNGIDFIDAGKVKGVGNSNITNNYNFTDYNPYSGTSYYRLKQVDFDGKENYSSITSASLYNNRELSLTLFPNPSNRNIVNIKSNSNETSNFELFVTDISGREVFHSENNNGSVCIPANEFQKGIFFVTAVSGENIVNIKLINN